MRNADIMLAFLLHGEMLKIWYAEKEATLNFYYPLTMKKEDSLMFSQHSVTPLGGIARSMCLFRNVFKTKL